MEGMPMPLACMCCTGRLMVHSPDGTFISIGCSHPHSAMHWYAVLKCLLELLGLCIQAVCVENLCVKVVVLCSLALAGCTIFALRPSCDCMVLGFLN